MKRWVGALAAVSFVVSSSAFAQEDLAVEGKEAPGFAAPRYLTQGPFVGPYDFVGDEPKDPETKLLMVSFMASWCAPCKKEMPFLQAMSEAYRADGLRVMMVSIDDEDEGHKKIEELMKLNKVTFPIVKDRTTFIRRRWLGEKSPLPSMFFVRRDGVIVKIHRGYDEKTGEQIQAEVTGLLGVAPKPLNLPTPVPAVAETTGSSSTVIPASATEPANATGGSKSLEMPPPPMGMQKKAPAKKTSSKKAKAKAKKTASP